MTTVLKLGGELLEDRAGDAIAAAAAIVRARRERRRWSSCMAAAARSTPSCARAATTPQFVDGLRVTDAAALDAVVAVLAGRTNTALVAALGAPAAARSGSPARTAASALCEQRAGVHDGRRRDVSISGSSGSPTAMTPSLLHGSAVARLRAGRREHRRHARAARC